MNDETKTKMVALACEYGLPVDMDDAPALERFVDELLRRAAAVEAKYEPNTIYCQGTDGAGKKTWMMVTTSGLGDSHTISAALELVRAIKRGIDINPDVLFKHLVGREYPVREAKPYLPLPDRKTIEQAKAMLTGISVSGMIARHEDLTLTANAHECISLVCDLGAILAKMPQPAEVPAVSKAVAP